MVSAFTAPSLSFPLSSLWFEIQTKADSEVSQTQITPFSSLILPPFCLAFTGSDHMVESWSWGNCLKGSGKVPTPLPCGQPWATPLCCIFTGRKKKKKRKPLGQQPKNSGKEKLLSQGRERKGEGRAPAARLCHESIWVSWLLQVSGWGAQGQGAPCSLPTLLWQGSGE